MSFKANLISGTLSGSLSRQNGLTGSLANSFLRGYSAYECALASGFEGTIEEWLESLKGASVIFKQDGIAIYWKYDNEADDQYRLLIDLSEYENKDISSDRINHENISLSQIINTYITNVNYDELAFDTTEIVINEINTTSVLGQAILGQMILA